MLARSIGAILHVLYAEPNKTLAGVNNFLSDPRRPIETTPRAMMTTPHLGESGVHPVIASSARELLNKSDNERSGFLSTAMSFLGLYRDPVVATVTRQCDWRIRDLVEGAAPATLYLVVPTSDMFRSRHRIPQMPKSNYRPLAREGLVSVSSILNHAPPMSQPPVPQKSALSKNSRSFPSPHVVRR